MDLSSRLRTVPRRPIAVVLPLLAVLLSPPVHAAGKAPYLVVAKLRRKYIDANRPQQLALDSPEARPYYDYYHQSVRRFVGEIRRNYPAGLLIDVYGQNKNPDVIMRGTINGRAVDHLLRQAGVAAGGHSEDAGFNGGYTVFTYGSHNFSGIDAVQFEFGGRYRQKAVVDQSARDAARAIAAFYEAYLRNPAALSRTASERRIGGADRGRSAPY